MNRGVLIMLLWSACFPEALDLDAEDIIEESASPTQVCERVEDCVNDDPRCHYMECTDHKCTYGLVQCGNGTSCKFSTCDRDLGCVVQSKVRDGTPCSDGDPCTERDACHDGECVSVPVDCHPSPCRLNTRCVPNETSFECVYDSVPDDIECDDDDHCTTGERCSLERCIGQPVQDDDWALRLAPGTTFGNDALTVDAAGAPWWIVSVTGDTSFATDVGVTLPDGAATGLAVVRLDASGMPQTATLAAWSSGEVRLSPAIDEPVRVVPTAGSGAARVMIVATFTGELRWLDADGVEQVATPRGPRGWFLATFAASGRAERVLVIESGRFVDEQIVPHVALNSSGAALVAVPVSAQRDAELVGLDVAPSGVDATHWVIAFDGDGERVWDDELFGDAELRAIDLADDGTAWLSGSYDGALSWPRNAHAIEPSQGSGDVFAMRLASLGDCTGHARLTGSGLDLRLADAAAAGDHVALAVAFPGALYRGGDAQPIVPADALIDDRLALVVYDDDVAFVSVTPLGTLDVPWLGVRPDAVVVARSDEERLRFVGIPTNGATPWNFAVLEPSGGALLARPSIALSGPYGLLVGARAIAGSYAAGPETFATDEPFVVRVNDADARVCK